MTSKKSRSTQLHVESLEDRRMLSVTPPINIVTQTVAIVSTPTISNQTASNVSATAATLNATVDSDHGDDITERGFLYAATTTDANPQLSDTGVMQAIVSGTTGAFQADIAGLTPGVAYSFVGYATNANGTAYTSVGTLTTLDAPSISSPTSSKLTATTATLGGDVSSDGGDPITERGIVYALTSDNPDPQLGDTNVTTATASGTTGMFAVDISGLAKGQTYSFVAYATNSTGTTFTSAATMTTLDAPTITSPAVTNLKATSATIGGTVTGDSGDLITARGAVYSLSSENMNPKIGDSDTMQFTAGGSTGAFVIDLTSLNRGTTYSYAMFATNSSGTTYTSVATLTTLDVPTIASPTVGNLKSTSVTLGGDVTADGADPITRRGVIYAVSSAETDLVLDSADATVAIADGTTGVFAVDLSGLTRGTSYTFVAYATNSSGTTYTPATTLTTLDVPTITSPTASDITSTSVTLGANVTSDGNDPITGRGVVYSLTSVNANPQLGDGNSTELDAGGTTGTFAISITGLAPGMSYSFATFATNSTGTTNTAVGSFATLPTAPVVGAASARFVTATEAMYAGAVSDDGGRTISARGILYSRVYDNANPQLGGDGVNSVASLGTLGQFTVDVKGLQAGIVYAFVAYATNGEGTVYSEVQLLKPLFQPATSGAVGDTPKSVAVGDFNGDGQADIVTVNSRSANLSVKPGDGAGGFGATTNYTAGRTPDFVTVADVNGDQRLDLVVTNGDSRGSVSVLLGNGDGTFQAAANYAVGNNPVSATVGDFNGDGQVDLAVANQFSNTVSVLLGNAMGGFNAATSYTVGAQPDSIVIGDFNGDHVLDLATANRGSGDVSILAGRGNGDFYRAQNFRVGVSPAGLVAADFNNDGLMDLAVAGQATSTVDVLLGGGFKLVKFAIAGGPSPINFQKPISFATGAQPVSIVVGDFNSDGILDLATADLLANAASVLLGVGDGSFAVPTNFSVGSKPQSLAVGDLNGDHRDDLVIANALSNNVTLLLQPSAPTVGAPSAGDITPFSARLSATVSSDASDTITRRGFEYQLLSIDGHPRKSRVVTVWADGSTGAMSVDISRLAPGGTYHFWAFATNGFGTTETAMAEFTTPAVVPSVVRASGHYVTPSEAVFTGRVADDGGADISERGLLYAVTYDNANPQLDGAGVVRVVADGATGRFTVDVKNLLPGATYSFVMYATNRVGTTYTTVQQLSPIFQPATSVETGDTPTVVAVADFNADGNADLVTINSRSGDLGLQLADGHGGFGLPMSIVAGLSPTSVAVGDVNGDGFKDLVVTSSDGFVNVLISNHDGTFQDAVEYEVGVQPSSVTLGDFNSDGYLDIAVANEFSNSVSILLGDGLGEFSHGKSSKVGNLPVGIVLGDFNGDSILDLATVNQGSNDVSVLLGDGAGGFQRAHNIKVGDVPTSIALGDFNGDGRLDIATANQGSDDVSILLNDGRRGFGRATSYDVGSQPVSITTGDFNDDGITDLATANQGSDYVSILLGGRRGRFQAADNIGVGSNPQFVATGDVNGDALADLVVANSYSNSVTVLLHPGAPTIGSPTQTNVTPFSVTLGGDVTGDGAALITDRGVLYSISDVNGNPQLGGLGVTKLSTLANSTGVFTVDVSDLSPGVTYTFVAFATNRFGVTYTTPVAIVTTPPDLPTVGAGEVSDIGKKSATVSGAVTNDGGGKITDEGVVYSLTSNNDSPQIGGEGVMQIAADEPGEDFSLDLAALRPGSTYAVAVYAKNGAGITYSKVFEFTTAAQPNPVVTAVSDALATTADTVTITGTDFNPDDKDISVVFNNGAIGEVTEATENSITVTFTTKPTSAGPLTVIVTSNGLSSGDAVQVANIAPVVIKSTSSLVADASTMTIAGFGFDPTAANNTITFNNGAVGTVTAATATSLTVTFSTMPTSAGKLCAVVTSNGQTSGSTLVATVIPVITSSASNLAANAATVTISGFGFDPIPANNSVTFNNGAVGSVTSATPTSLTVTFSTMPTTAGKLCAWVSSNDQSSSSSVKVATVTPVVTASSMSLSATAATLVIEGFGFDPIAANNSVKFDNGAVGTITAATATTLTVSLAKSPTTAGALNAVVTVNGQTFGTEMQVATVIPVITSSTATLAANANSLVINGWGFDPTPANNSVTFNDGAVGTVTAATTTSLTVTFSTMPTAAGALSAWLSSNGQSSAGSVTVANVVPVVVSSTTSRAANATTLTISGFGFDSTPANNSVTFSNGAVGSVTAATSTSLTIALSTGPTTAGGFDVTVSTNGQSNGSAVQVATITPVVTASSTALAANPSSVTINGFGFDPIAANNSVAFNNGAVGSVSSATSTSLIVSLSTSPSSAAGLTAIVTTSGLTSGAALQVATLKPTVASPTSAGVTSSAATLGGTVTGDGGATITERGVLLALSAGEPSLTLGAPNVTKLTASGTTGAFTVNATGLAGGKTYAYVAYAVNSAGVTYTSPYATFSTAPGLQVSSFSPTIVAAPATNLTINSATLTGNTVSSGGAAITARGIVLALSSNSSNPHVGDAGAVNLTAAGTTGIYTLDATGLSVGRSYAFAAYATNVNGTSYSSVGTFSTLPAVGQLTGVTLQVIGHQLILTGDNTADHIQVTGDETAREYVITGLNGTVINGVANAAITVQGIDSMLVNLTAGADIVTIDGADLAGGLTIGGGSGNKQLSIGATSDVSVGASVSISGGAGNDVILVNRTHVIGNMVIQGGSGGVSNQITTRASTITGDLTIYGASGYDLVQQTQLTIGGAWTISTGAGNDLISVANSKANGPVIFNSGTGADFIAADTLTLAGNLALDGSAGGGFKNIVLSNSIIGAAVYETGGAMGNSLSFNNNVAQALVVGGGVSNDAVFVRTSILDQLFANLGDGADSMDIRFTRVKKVASLDAGLQTDSLTQQGNWTDSLTTVNFENIANY